MVSYPSHTAAGQASQRQITSTKCRFLQFLLTTALLKSVEEKERPIFMTKTTGHGSKAQAHA